MKTFCLGADFPRREILRQVALEQRVLANTPDNPFRDSDLENAAKDSALLESARGENLGEMESAAEAREKRSTVKTILFGAGAVLGAGIFVAAALAGVGIPAAAGGIAAALFSRAAKKADDERRESAETRDAISRWDYAVAHQSFRMLD